MHLYIDKLGLKHDPFADDYLRDDFYGGGNRDNLVYRLLDHESRDVSLDAVVGPAGGGKTRLAHRLCECAPEGDLPVLVAVDLFSSAGVLLGDILRELDVRAGADQTESLEILNTRTIDLTRAGKSILLLIDNAHELGPDCLRLVERLLASRWSAIHIVLIGEDQLADMLQTRLRQRHRDRLEIHQLPTLNRVETAYYIQLKLARAGYGRNLSMTSQDALDVLQHCGGLPRRINSLTAAMLNSQIRTQAGAVNSRGQVGQQPPEEKPAGEKADRPEIRYLWHAFALSIALVAVLFWPVDSPESSAPATAPRIQSQAIALPEPARAEPVAPDFATGAVAANAGQNPIPVLSEFETLLLATPAENFTVQLMDSAAEEEVLAFIAGEGLGGIHGYYETRRDRSPWFIAVDGIYPDWEAAREAQTRLADNNTEMDPWIRRVSNVHAEIARSGKRRGP